MNLFPSFLTLVAWVLWGCTILFVDPDVTLAPVLFYGTLFIALTCTLARLMGGGVQAEKERPTGGFGANFGNAAVVSTLLLFALWLQSMGTLTSLNGGLLAIAFLLVEVGFFFSSGGRKSRGRRRLRAMPAPETGPARDR